MPWSSDESVREWLLPRVLELIYTARELQPFAADCGWDGPPLRWDDDRRFLLRCDLNAAIFHLYLPADAKGDWHPARRSDGCPRGETPEQLADLRRRFPTPRDAVTYIMDTFSIVRRKDEEKHGDYRTKRLILEIYDTMLESVAAGKSYRTRLDPRPLTQVAVRKRIATNAHATVRARNIASGRSPPQNADSLWDSS